MLSLHKKRRMILSTIATVAVFLPATIFAISKTAVSNNTYALTYPIPEGYTSIVDPNFYDCVASTFISTYILPSEEIPETGLTDSQLARIERLICDGSGKPDEALISDVTGLDKMSALYYLDLGNNQLTSIDLSDNPGMWYLDLNSNQLTSINLPDSTVLDQAYLYSNQLTSIDISHNTKLTRLDIFDNQLTFIDTSSNVSKLQTLKADDIYLYTGIVPTKSGSNYIYNLSELKYIKDGSHGPDGNVDFTIENTSSYSYDDFDMILTVSDLAGAGGYVPISGSIDDYSYKLKLAAVLDFDTNGGSGNFDIMNCYVEPEASNCTVTLPTTIPTRNDYYFLGWADSANATMAAYTAGGNVSLDMGKTIYAIWAPIHTLNYNSNGGSTAPEAESCHANDTTSGCNIIISSAELTRDDYNFLGWADSAIATSATYHGGDSISLSADKTIYAVWSQNTNTYTLNFDANNGSNAPDEVTCTTTTTLCSVEIPTNIPTRNGYTFLGWAESANATTAAYTAGNSISLNANKTIYAVWEIINTTLTLSFNLNGGDGTIESLTCDINVNNQTCTARIPEEVPNRDGYTFLGWADSANATTAVYQGGDTITLSADRIIYAVWGEIDDEEEPGGDESGNDNTDEEDLPVPNTGANTITDNGAILTITMTPVIIAAAYRIIRRYGHKN